MINIIQLDSVYNQFDKFKKKAKHNDMFQQTVLFVF